MRRLCGLTGWRLDPFLCHFAGKCCGGTADNPHVLQREFIDEQAIQCGYCANGVIMTAAALLRSTPSPDKEQIAQALSGHLCRCGAQPRMLKAVSKAVEILNSEKA
jgi:aerobic-type carbon monoxide dehydrogenase small subunit (CoxS/CutS family)